MIGQISTSGGGAQLEEHMSAISSPSIRNQTFVNIERMLGDAFEKVVTSELLGAGEDIDIESNYHQSVPAITVVVDAGCKS